MWLLSSSMFYTSLAIVSYTYVGYPLLVSRLARVRPRVPIKADIEPTVTVILAARNEQACLRAKLENLLALDYPAHKREIIVVSDGSTDETDAIVTSFADRGVILERNPVPSGKPTGLNRGVARATGELVLFCDARQEVDRGALRALVRPFADPEVGAVSGVLHIPSQKGPGVYWRYEAFIRACESKVDSMVGCTGAFYAIRRKLFRPLPADALVDDVFTPLQIVLRGYRVIVEDSAQIFDVEAPPASEFSRKARTLAGNYQLLGQLPQLLDPRRNRVMFQFVSHKLARLVCPFALVGLLASNVVLVVTFAPGWPFYVATLGAQVATYGLALRGALAGERAGKLARIAHTFVTLNLAAVEGLRRFLMKDMRWTAAPAARVTPQAPQVGIPLSQAPALLWEPMQPRTPEPRPSRLWVWPKPAASKRASEDSK